MKNKLPTVTPEQLDFANRMAAEMVPLVKGGMDMLAAERQAARRVAAAILTAGTDPDNVAALLDNALRRTDVGQRVLHSDILPSPGLQERWLAAFKASGGRRLPPIGILVEKRVTTPTGFPCIIYSNESKHQGLPHITILLGDDRVNVTIAQDPKVLVGNKRSPGLKAALRAVAACHVDLLQEWNDSRPDDQRLENSKRRLKAAARAKKG